MWQEGTSLIPEVCAYFGREVTIPGRSVGPGLVSPSLRANLHWKHRVQGRAIMFGQGFEDCWYEVPGAAGLKLSGDLRFRGRHGIRKLRVDCNGRPYVLARRIVGRSSMGAAREGKVMLHRSVMAVVLGRQLGRDEFVCHRDDDPGNNWPDNLYLGDPQSNAADSLRNGRFARGDRHPCTKIKDAQVREIRLALARGERGVDLARVHCVHRSTISRIKHRVRRGAS
jgi:hypothetical protein